MCTKDDGGGGEGLYLPRVTFFLNASRSHQKNIAQKNVPIERFQYD